MNAITALLSVSDKSGIADFARALHARGVQLLSTGGTAQLLAREGLPVTEVSQLTGFPEMLDGRVKTLHPRIHAGLLARRDDPAHLAALREHGIGTIELLVVNLYPFAQTVARPGCTLAEAIENIDIGGPAMLRAAAKNWSDVGVVVDPADYGGVLAELATGGLSRATKFRLAQKTFAHTAAYDGMIASWLTSLAPGAEDRPDAAPAREPYPRVFNLQLTKKQDLRYGENPHQSAAFYADSAPAPGTLARAEQLQGKELSYNNIADADAAWECVKSFGAALAPASGAAGAAPANGATSAALASGAASAALASGAASAVLASGAASAVLASGATSAACVIVKHANPCGVAVGATPLEAYRKALQTDPTSAFGGIVAFNRTVGVDVVEAIDDAKQFIEVLIAPAFDALARERLAKKTNLRLLQVPLACAEAAPEPGAAWSALDAKRVGGGVLLQSADRRDVTSAELKVVTRKEPSMAQRDDLLFACKVAKFVKSNAIVFCGGGMTLGVGAGQMSRIDSARIAAIKAANAGLSLAGSVVASDAFFPFRDGLDAVVDAGARCVIQPGGSMRDAEVIAAADERGIAMVFTGVRHFRH